MNSKEIRFSSIFQDILYEEKQERRFQESNAVFQGVVSLLTLAVLLFVTFVYAVQRDISNEKFVKSQQASQEIIIMSSRLYDLDFYVKVIVPSWEVAFKWLYWKGVEGDSFRYDVIAGTYLYLDGKSSYFFDIKQANLMLNYSTIRNHPHYKPYGLPHSALDQASILGPNSEPNVISHLSEHNALTIWFGFWERVAHLKAQELVTAKDVREAFGDFFGHWYLFFTEYRRVAALVIDEMEKKNGNVDLYSKSRLINLERLEKIFKLTEEKYRAEEKGMTAEGRAKQIASQIWRRHMDNEQSK